jgi:hypothetical protein
VRAVGEWYRENFPAECDRSFLESRLGWVMADQCAGAHAGSIDSPGPGFEAAVDHDLRHGDAVYIGGWVVARTEARFCAYLALS